MLPKLWLANLNEVLGSTEWYDNMRYNMGSRKTVDSFSKKATGIPL